MSFSPGVRKKLAALYLEIDTRVSRLVALHERVLTCKRGCVTCCEDDLTIYSIEAENIKVSCPEVCVSSPHVEGACAFLDNNGACRIYAARPYVCRTQGLPLQWFDELEDGQLVAYRDICPKNDEKGLLEGLTEDESWVIGPVEERLSALQYEYGAGSMLRVALRNLFATGV